MRVVRLQVLPSIISVQLCQPFQTIYGANDLIYQLEIHFIVRSHFIIIIMIIIIILILINNYNNNNSNNKNNNNE